MTNDVLISIPLFVFMGYIIERANILDRLFQFAAARRRPVPASLALATLATCAIFATATGIVGACVTLMGLLAFPAMLRAGYDVEDRRGRRLRRRLPRHPHSAERDADSLRRHRRRLGGQALRRRLLPGIMLAGLYILYTVIMALLNPKLAPQLPEERNVPFCRSSGAGDLVPAAVGLIAAALGSIIFGLATPSEAAAMGSLGALLLAVGYGADYSRTGA